MNLTIQKFEENEKVGKLRPINGATRRLKERDEENLENRKPI